MKLHYMAYGERRRKLKISSRALRTERDRSRHKQWVPPGGRLRDIRYLPGSFDSPGMILIFGDHVAMITYERGGFGWVATSKETAQMLRSVFRALWEFCEGN